MVSTWVGVMRRRLGAVLALVAALLATTMVAVASPASAAKWYGFTVLEPGQSLRLDKR